MLRLDCAEWDVKALFTHVWSTTVLVKNCLLMLCLIIGFVDDVC